MTKYRFAVVSMVSDMLFGNFLILILFSQISSINPTGSWPSKLRKDVGRLITPVKRLRAGRNPKYKEQDWLRLIKW